jgi:flagellar hook-associated protein 2
MTGLSGIDTESMVQALMQAEGYKLTKLKKQNQIHKWQQEKYREIGSKLDTFQATFLKIGGAKSILSDGTFAGFATTVKLSGAVSEKATVRTGANSKAGTYKLNIQQLAEKASATSGKYSKGDQLTTSSFNKDELKAGDTLKFSLDGVSKTITFEEADLNGDDAQFAAALKAKLDAAYKLTPGSVNEFSVNANGSNLSIGLTQGGHELKIHEGSRNSALTSITGGAFADGFKISDGSNDEDGNPTVSNIGPYNFSINGTNIDVAFSHGQDLSKMADEINKAVSNKVSILEAKLRDKSFDTDAGETEESVKAELKEIREDVAGFKASVSENKIVFSNSNANAEMKITSTAGSMDLLTFLKMDNDATPGNDVSFELENTSVIGDVGFASGASSLDVTKKILSEVYGSVPNSPLTVNGVSININANDTLDSLMSKINSSEAGVTVTYDKMGNTFKMEAKGEGEVNGFTFDDFNDDSKFSSEIRDIFGFNFGGATPDPVTGDLDSSGSKFNAAKDAKFTVNGVETTRSSNTFTVDEVSITLNETTKADEELRIDIAKDSSTALTAIKEFVTAYNELIAAINTEVSTSRPKSGKYSYYEPLTDEEKEAMSESEVKLWEEKAKTGLLSRDSILSKITGDMRTALYQKVDIGGGKFLSLHEIGITTTDRYADAGKLQIDEEKLKKALEENGDAISKMFTGNGVPNYNANGHLDTKLGLSERLNNVVESAIGSKGTITDKAGVLSRAGSLKFASLTKKIEDYDDRIADMLNYLADKEDNYYMMFSKMEQAVTEANNQMNYLMSQMGG